MWSALGFPSDQRSPRKGLFRWTAAGSSSRATWGPGSQCEAMALHTDHAAQPGSDVQRRLRSAAQGCGSTCWRGLQEAVHTPITHAGAYVLATYVPEPLSTAPSRSRMFSRNRLRKMLPGIQPGRGQGGHYTDDSSACSFGVLRGDCGACCFPPLFPSPKPTLPQRSSACT